jgi:predicted dehydrogenase
MSAGEMLPEHCPCVRWDRVADPQSVLPEPSIGNIAELSISPSPLPKQMRPIVIVGAGGIVRDAHLPAYAKGGMAVLALVDQVASRAEEMAAAWNVPYGGGSLERAIAMAGSVDNVIFDVAVPAAQVLGVLRELPHGAAVLIQKPMGESLAEAEAIVRVCEERSLTAAVNFQLRWAPNMVAARRLTDAGVLGTLHDVEVRVSVHMPWELWTFLSTAPRLEIAYHSIHYIDLVRSWLGEPRRVYARTVRNPRTATLSATKTALILDYGDWMRAVITTNHAQDWSIAHQHSYVQWEGTANAMRAQMGVNLNYPKGEPDTLELFRDPAGTGEPVLLPVAGNWFPDAFLGVMGALQGFLGGERAVLPTRVADALNTMRVVEAAYRSSETGEAVDPMTLRGDQLANGNRRDDE